VPEVSVSVKYKFDTSFIRPDISSNFSWFKVSRNAIIFIERILRINSVSTLKEMKMIDIVIRDFKIMKF